jgi:hypothetical protein
MENKIIYIRQRVIIIALLYTSILHSSTYFELKIDSCTLKIPQRYSQKMIFHTPNEVSFLYQEEKDVNTSKAIFSNFFLAHKITILREKNHEIINENDEDFNLISKKNINGIQVFRFKGRMKKTIKNPNEGQLKNINMFKQNNYFHIFGNDFYIVVQETDEYADDIYQIIEDCKGVSVTK